MVITESGTHARPWDGSDDHHQVNWYVNTYLSRYHCTLLHITAQYSSYRFASLASCQVDGNTVGIR